MSEKLLPDISTKSKECVYQKIPYEDELTIMFVSGSVQVSNINIHTCESLFTGKLHVVFFSLDNQHQSLNVEEKVFLEMVLKEEIMCIECQIVSVYYL